MRISLLDKPEAYESRQLEIAHEAGARRRVVRVVAQNLRKQQRAAHDPEQVPHMLLEEEQITPVAAVFQSVAVPFACTGTSGRARRFGNIIVPRIFLFRTFARRTRQSLRHDG